MMCVSDNICVCIYASSSFIQNIIMWSFKNNKDIYNEMFGKIIWIIYLCKMLGAYTTSF